MDVRILDLDGSLTAQPRLTAQCQPVVCRVADWAPRIRLACGFGAFRRFEAALARQLESEQDGRTTLTFYGSGDFHHVSLALLRRLRTPFNLLVIDNHPDWMRGVPFLHCGTWVWHASRLPLVRQVFHVGGDVDFDNFYRWLAPWQELRSGRFRVCPARRRFRGWPWGSIEHRPLRTRPDRRVTPARLERLLQPHRADLARWPLYISLDKDVMRGEDAVVNWDSGHLHLREVELILEAFWDGAEGKLAGMDIVGDWSPVQVQGALRQAMHLTMHPALKVDPAAAARLNEQVNLRLLKSAPLRARGLRPLAA